MAWFMFDISIYGETCSFHPSGLFPKKILITISITSVIFLGNDGLFYGLSSFAVRNFGARESSKRHPIWRSTFSIVERKWKLTYVPDIEKVRDSVNL